MASSATNLVSIPSVHLQPPDCLTEAQAKIWRETVECRSADFFGPDSVPLLEEYVRVVDMCRGLAVPVGAAMAGGSPVELKTILDIRDKESRRLKALATALRITNQSRYTPQAAATASKKGAGGKVWQFGNKVGS